MPLGHGCLTLDLVHESALGWAHLLWAALAHEFAVSCELLASSDGLGWAYSHWWAAL